MRYSALLPALVFSFHLFFFSTVNAQENSAPSLSFSPAEITVGLGQEATTAIVVDTAGYDVGGAGVIIRYNPQQMEVVAVNRGSAFVDYPLTFFDNKTGEVRLSGVVSGKDSLFRGKGEVGTITWKGVSLGTTQATIVFTKGSTKDSNIAVLTGNGDILESVTHLQATVQSGQAQPVVVPTVVNARPFAAVITPEPVKDIPVVGGILRLLGVQSNSNNETGPIVSQEPNNRTTLKQPPVTKVGKSTTVPVYIIILIAIVVLFILVIIVKKRKKKSLPPDPAGMH